MPLSKPNPASLTQPHIPPNNNIISNSKQRANTVSRSLSEKETGLDSRSSSGQVWAEDYYNCETEAKENPREDLYNLTYPAPPPLAALTSSPFPNTSPLSKERESSSARHPQTQQQSFTSLLPFSRSPERDAGSPTKVDIKGDFMATLTGDKDGVIKIADKRGGLSSWFSGSSTPVAVGIPMAQEATMSREGSPERQSPRLKKSPTSPSTPAKTNIGGGMFGFFTPKTPAKTQQTVQIPAELNDDEFLTLDVTSALFPSGEPSANDPFSPAAFKNLLMNAEGLLLKLQTSYKLRSISLHELSAEKEAMTEEIEEAETRAKCLKNQLEDMAHQLAMKDAAIGELAAELAAEKHARVEEKLAREQSIALVKARAEKRGSNTPSTMSEDLGISSVTDKRRKRISNGSSNLSIEGDSDAESGVDSVFSRSRSPTFTVSSVSVAGTVDSTPEIMQASFARVVPNPGQSQNQTSPRPPFTRQKSTFQKILSGMTAAEEARNPMSGDPYEGIGMGGEGCVNCRGKEASVAWDAVGLMRAENKGLKERVGELERAVEGALDLCDRL